MIGMADIFLQIALQYGLLGIFFVATALNASVLLPLPFDIIFIAIAGLRLFDPVLLGIAAGAGAALGEMAGYAAGYFGSRVIEKFSPVQMKMIFDFKKRIKDLGTVFVFLGALIPFPFDFIGIAAGLIKFDWKRFFIAVLCGRIIRYILIAVAIYYGLEAIQGFFAISG